MSRKTFLTVARDRGRRVTRAPRLIVPPYPYL